MLDQRAARSARWSIVSHSTAGLGGDAGAGALDGADAGVPRAGHHVSRAAAGAGHVVVLPSFTGPHACSLAAVPPGSAHLPANALHNMLLCFW